jgi:hypothetical protein
MKNLITLCLVIMSSVLVAQQTIYLRLEVAELTPTQKVYDFIVDDYNHIIGSQYTILFDGSKMRFNGIRNPLPENLTSHSFNEPVSGELRHVWIDPDLSAESYEEPTAIYQLVFDIIEGEGSILCLTNLINQYLFIYGETPEPFQLSQIVIDDDCNEGLILDLTTNTTEAGQDTQSSVHALTLATDGILHFTSDLDQIAGFTLFDSQGHLLNTIQPSVIFKGRQQRVFNTSLLPAPYMVQVQIPGQPSRVHMLVPN